MDRWLAGTSWVLALFGVGMAALAASPAHGLLVTAFAGLAWPEPAPEALGAWGRLSFGISGALCAGWGVSLQRVAVGRADQSVGAGLAVWFVVDGVASVLTGFPWNALFNVAFAAPFLLALRARPGVPSPSRG